MPERERYNPERDKQILQGYALSAMERLKSYKESKSPDNYKKEISKLEDFIDIVESVLERIDDLNNPKTLSSLVTYAMRDLNLTET